MFCFQSIDDRFILKQIKSIEISAFEDFAPRYLDYVNKALEERVSISGCVDDNHVVHAM